MDAKAGLVNPDELSFLLGGSHGSGGRFGGRADGTGPLEADDDLAGNDSLFGLGAAEILGISGDGDGHSGGRNRSPSPYGWLHQRVFDRLMGAADALGMFQDVRRSLLRQERAWHEWIKAPAPETLPAPDVLSWSPFQTLLAVKVLREDRFLDASTQYVSLVLGREFVQGAPLDLVEVVTRGAASIPVLFLLSPGSDPTTLVEETARTVDSSRSLAVVSLGQGISETAVARLQAAAAAGEWLLIQNLHLDVDLALFIRDFMSSGGGSLAAPGAVFSDTRRRPSPSSGEPPAFDAGDPADVASGASIGLFAVGSTGGDTEASTLASNRHGARRSSSAVTPTAAAAGRYLHPNFRLFLSTEPVEYFPPSVAVMSVKVTNEHARGIRAGLQRAFAVIPPSVVDYHSAYEWTKLLYAVTFLHVVLQVGWVGW